MLLLLLLFLPQKGSVIHQRNRYHSQRQYSFKCGPSCNLVHIIKDDSLKRGLLSLLLPTTCCMDCPISPAIFQNFMNEVFLECLHHFVIFYIDGILVYSMEPGWTSPAKHHFYLKLKTCKVCQTVRNRYECEQETYANVSIWLYSNFISIW